MKTEIQSYNDEQSADYVAVCNLLAEEIQKSISQDNSKVWHGHPVWFIEENPIVGYSVEKPGVRLMFWSGRSFDEPELTGTSRFQDASIFYTSIDQIDKKQLTKWLEKAHDIQWDYKNIVKRKGVLERIK